MIKGDADADAGPLALPLGRDHLKRAHKCFTNIHFMHSNVIKGLEFLMTNKLKVKLTKPSPPQRFENMKKVRETFSFTQKSPHEQ